jgi:hypothetical protein
VGTPFFSFSASSASVVPPCLHFSMKAGERGVAWPRRARQRVLGRDGAEGHAHDGVGAGGEHVHAAVLDERAVGAADVVREGEAHALALADPVAPASAARARASRPGSAAAWGRLTPASSSSAYCVIFR